MALSAKHLAWLSKMGPTSLLQRHLGAGGVAQHQAWLRTRLADPGNVETQTQGQRSDGLPLGGGGAEKQFVVVAAGQQALRRRAEQLQGLTGRRSDGNRSEVNLGTDTGSLQQMAKVGRKPV